MLNKMKIKPLNTSILFLIFNRPDTTQRVFNEIKKVQPKQLFVVSDGARSEDEKEIVNETRKIIDQVDWDCEVHKNYSDKNLGCKIRVSSGINWFFENVEQGIILEDDCLPSQSFFWFCEELLNKYKNNEKIMMISGDNFQLGKNKVSCDYYFSKRNFHIWGWATWKKAWGKYNLEMKEWPKIKNSKILEETYLNKKVLKEKKEVFENTYSNLIDTWDYQWLFTCILNKGLSIIPNKNLVSNIGFGKKSTHAKDAHNPFSKIKNHELKFPLTHPEKIFFNEKADDFTENYKKAFIFNFFVKIKVLVYNLYKK